MTAPLVSVVDDDARLRTALCGLMRSLGYRTTNHACAEDFLASEAIEQANCVVTDIHMPGLDGFQLKSAIDRRRPDVPVIMITGRADELMRKRALDCGAHFFSKPFDADALSECLANIL